MFVIVFRNGWQLNEYCNKNISIDASFRNKLLEFEAIKLMPHPNSLGLLLVLIHSSLITFVMVQQTKEVESFSERVLHLKEQELVSV